MGLLRSEGEKTNRRRLIVPSSLHRTYGAITCTLSPVLVIATRVDNEEARRRVEVYASQSGEARTRQFARAMALGYRFYFLDEAGPVRVNEGWGRFLSSACRVIQTLVQAFMVPALRKLREERGTRFVGDTNEIKGRASPPML